jgi:S1-C subfamily serine protease
MSLTKNNQTKENLCGLLIAKVIAPTAKDAGLVAGEVIKTVNGYPVGDMNALTHALADKRPNDTVTVITNANTYNVTLSTSPQNPQQVALGIKVKTIECGK